MKNIFDVSVIISTYGNDDGVTRLNKILVALRDQKIEENISYEVVIVDNGCSLNKDRLLSEYSEIKNLVIIGEPKIGLSNARNKGILNAQGNIIIFTDDDIAPSQEWISSLYKSHHTSNALCVGGPVILQDKSQNFPNWFSDYFLRFLLPPKFPEKFGVISQPFYLIGANMSFKRAVFQKYGLFDTSLGRKGSCLLSGEDTEFILRLNKNDVYYDPNAKVFTKIKSNRLTKRFFLKRIFWQAVSDARIFRKHEFSGFYDVNEVFLSRKFLKNFYRTLVAGNFFELSCIITRFLTFKVFLIFKL
jgi:glycosyltransferase involved in cell wall biosynthesis